MLLFLLDLGLGTTPGKLSDSGIATRIPPISEEVELPLLLMESLNRLAKHMSSLGSALHFCDVALSSSISMARSTVVMFRLPVSSGHPFSCKLQTGFGNVGGSSPWLVTGR